MVIYPYNPRTQAEAERLTWIYGQLVLHSKSHASLDFEVFCIFFFKIKEYKHLKDDMY